MQVEQPPRKASKHEPVAAFVGPSSKSGEGGNQRRKQWSMPTAEMRHRCRLTQRRALKSKPAPALYGTAAAAAAEKMLRSSAILVSPTHHPARKQHATARNTLLGSMCREGAVGRWGRGQTDATRRACSRALRRTPSACSCGRTCRAAASSALSARRGERRMGSWRCACLRLPPPLARASIALRGHGPRMCMWNSCMPARSFADWLQGGGAVVFMNREAGLYCGGGTASNTHAAGRGDMQAEKASRKRGRAPGRIDGPRSSTRRDT
jgi:hypothetical protein